MELIPSEVLSDHGPLASSIQNFIARPLQQEMADAIAEVIANHESLICEAGTGTGKTFAYLVPALLSGQKILISTGTKHLQDQIYRRDLPTVMKALSLPVSIALLKGRANYLCLERLRSAENVQTNPKLLHEIMELKHWSQSTRSGDLNEVLAESSPVFSYVTSTTENCLGQDCDFYDQCFVLKARRAAQEADLIVVNHHLLLADMGLRETGFGELLPNVDAIVFDEAHQLPELASQFFGQSLTTRQLFELAEDTHAAYQQEAADIPDFMVLLNQYENTVRKLRRSFGPDDERIEWQRVMGINAAKDALTAIETELDHLHSTVGEISERGKALDSCYRRVGLALAHLQSFLHEQDQDMIQWLEVRGKGVLLHQTPLNVADTFQSRLSFYHCSGIYTSATLAMGDDFSHFAGQLGLQQVQTRTWPSPFDYQNQTLLYLPSDMPHPQAPEYTQTVITQSLPVLRASQGRAFLLFTSHKALRQAAQLIEGKLDYPILVQGDASRTELLQQFRDSEHSILLGTSSFWEGVDVKGSALSCVIIDKLPFATPDDPVLKARGRRMEEQGRNVFMEYQLPQAVITLKQGVGRLIRDEQDYGVLMICDPRLLTKSYGRIFLRSLPKMSRTHEIQDVIDFYERSDLAVS